MTVAIAERLRASARAIRADADERANALDALANELERGADLPFSVTRAATDLGVSPRVLRDAARRGDLSLEGPRSARVVRRSELDRWLAASAPKRRAQASAAPDDDHAAFARSALRLASGGRS